MEDLATEYVELVVGLRLPCLTMGWYSLCLFRIQIFYNSIIRSLDFGLVKPLNSLWLIFGWLMFECSWLLCSRLRMVDVMVLGFVDTLTGLRKLSVILRCGNGANLEGRLLGHRMEEECSLNRRESSVGWM